MVYAPPRLSRASAHAGQSVSLRVTLGNPSARPVLETVQLYASDPVARMTLHRGLSHSLLVLPLLGTAIWWLFLRFGQGRVAQSPRRWFWAISTNGG